MREDKIICVIQARMNSTRFPGKILASICGYPQLYHVIKRVMKSKVKDIIVATTINTEDDIIPYVLKCYNLLIPGIRGSENDVLSRYILAANTYKADAVIRITADCPLIDYGFIDEAIDIYNNNDVDYISFDNISYLEGVCNVEIIKTSVLKQIEQKTDNSFHREHVMTYITDNPTEFNIIIKKAPPNYYRISNYHLSVDTIEDLINVRKIYEYFSPRTDFSHDEIMEYLTK